MLPGLLELASGELARGELAAEQMLLCLDLM